MRAAKRTTHCNAFLIFNRASMSTRPQKKRKLEAQATADEAARQLSSTVQSENQTVTLTNWKRLTNTPTQFNVGRTQALVWGDYVVVIASSEWVTLHGRQQTAPSKFDLYHLKHKLWLQISTNSECKESPIFGLPFTVYNGDLIFVASSMNILKFSTNRWVTCPDLHVSQDCHGDFAIRYVESYGMLLSSKSLFQQSSETLVLLESVGDTFPKFFRHFQNSCWSRRIKLQKSNYVTCSASRLHLSLATVPGCLYISNGVETYCITATLPLPQVMPVTQIAKLPLDLFTISSVGDTLFAFGGTDEDQQPSSDIHRYNAQSNTWEPAGYMRNARYGAMVAPVIHSESAVTNVIVIGGYLGGESDKTVLLSRITESSEANLPE